ncbi:MAG: alternative ribosome rescue aminoacyl-tRNA hydrolase ArfB [Acidobacteriota bacterium]
MIQINHDVSIPHSELSFAASRSSGPGGQNVNKVSTRITLRFDLEGSPSLSPEQKALIGERLATRISKEGILSVSAQRERSQAANREAAVERFTELLQQALEVDPERRPVRVPARFRRRRLESKRRRSQVKKERSRRYPTDE